MQVTAFVPATGIAHIAGNGFPDTDTGGVQLLSRGAVAGSLQPRSPAQGRNRRIGTLSHSARMRQGICYAPRGCQDATTVSAIAPWASLRRVNRNGREHPNGLRDRRSGRWPRPNDCQALTNRAATSLRTPLAAADFGHAAVRLGGDIGKDALTRGMPHRSDGWLCRLHGCTDPLSVQA